MTLHCGRSHTARFHRHTAHRLRHAAGVLLLLGLAACQSSVVDPDGRAQSFRIVVTGESTVPLQLVVAKGFERRRDELTGAISTILILADTTQVTLPLDRRETMSTDRVLIRLRNASSVVTASVLMRIYFDDREVYSQSATLREAELEFSFTYF